MGKTISEKIIAKAAGKKEVTPGEVVYVKPDLSLSYVLTERSFKQLKELGVEKVCNPDRVVYFIDHLNPPSNPEEARTHNVTRDWCANQGVKALVDRKGIGHQVAGEMGFARPGTLIVHGDDHVSILGAFGAFSIGVGQDMLTVFALGECLLEVPGSLKVIINGNFSKGVMSRDLWTKINGDLGPDGASCQVMEFVGPTVEAMSVDSRMTLCCLCSGTGATTGIVNPDQKVIEFVGARTEEPFEVVESDTDAEYSDVINYDASRIEPMVAAPPDIYKARTLGEVEGMEINQGYIGSCASGRMEDLRIAAKILKGRKVRDGVRLYIIPSSNEIMLNAVREGLMEIFINAGASVFPPTCDFCFGKLGCLAAGERAVSTGTLNIPGRMGSTEAEIYLASPASVAASTVAGKIADPRKFV